MYVHVVPFTVFALLTLGCLAWLVVWVTQVAGRTDQASDDADRALGHVQAVVNHLDEHGPVQTGRHGERR